MWSNGPDQALSEIQSCSYPNTSISLPLFGNPWSTSVHKINDVTEGMQAIIYNQIKAYSMQIFEYIQVRATVHIQCRLKAL